MRENFNNLNSLGLTALVTVLSTGSLWGCKSEVLVCQDGTLAQNGVCPTAPITECLVGQRLNPATNACELVDPCANVNCGAVQLPGAATVSPQAQGANACICVPSACQASYELQAGACVRTVECPAGYRQEGGATCLPIEDVSCYDVPSSPICVPPTCAEHPTAADGTDLVAAGKCVQAQPPPAESCVTNCHQGIEDPHPWFGGADLTCTGCHGGNATATTRETAHVAIPQVWQVNSTQWGRPNLRYYWNYNTLFGVENFDGGLAWLKFRNPSDLRVADQSCGKTAGCHQARVENVRRGVMATEVGLTGVAQARNGIARTVIREGNAVYKWDTTEGMTMGWGELNATKYNGEYTGSVRKLVGFKIRNRENYGAYDQIDILRELYDKQCGDCHLGTAGANNRYADFRTSGCGSCHMSYALDGRSRSADQMIRKDEPTYPAAYAQIANFNANDLQNLNGAWLGPERSHPS